MSNSCGSGLKGRLRPRQEQGAVEEGQRQGGVAQARPIPSAGATAAAFAVLAFSGCSVLLSSSTTPAAAEDGAPSVPGPPLAREWTWRETATATAVDEGEGVATSDGSIFSGSGQAASPITSAEVRSGRTGRVFRRFYSCSISPDVISALFPSEFNPRDESSFSKVLGDGCVAGRGGGGGGGGITPPPTKDDLLLAGYSKAETQCGCQREEYDGRILNFPGTILFFNNEAADTHGGPRPVDVTWKELRKVLPDACGSLRAEQYCQTLQGTTESDVGALGLDEPWRRFNYLPPSDRAYVIGPHPDSSNSIQISLMARKVGFLLQPGISRGNRDAEDSIGWLWDHARKPRNTGEHFMVFLASNCVDFRDKAVLRIAMEVAAYEGGGIHVGDSWMNNICYRRALSSLRKELQAQEGDGGTVTDVYSPAEFAAAMKISPQPDHTQRDAHQNNAEIMSKYKFALVMENTYREGYITEKILNAFQGGSIPIWYGGKHHALEIFNEGAFIYYDVENPRPALERIKYLMNEPRAYQEMLRNAPILRDGKKTVEEFFSLRDDVGGGKLKNRIRHIIGMDQDT